MTRQQCPRCGAYLPPGQTVHMACVRERIWQIARFPVVAIVVLGFVAGGGLLLWQTDGVQQALRNQQSGDNVVLANPTQAPSLTPSSDESELVVNRATDDATEQPRPTATDDATATPDETDPATDEPDSATATSRPTRIPPTSTRRPTRTPVPDERLYAIVDTGGRKLNMRPEPSTGSGLVTQLDDGEEVEVISDTIRRSGYTWREVLNESGNQGWVVVRLGGQDTLRITDEPPNESTPVCPGAGRTLFEAGDRAVVDFNDGGALRALRDYRGGAEDTLAQFYDGNVLTLNEGPECYDGVWYWQIYYRPLQQDAWVAENNRSDRYLCPIRDPDCS